MNLTEHFQDYELGVAGNQQLIDNATFLCANILEAIRTRFGPVVVHDGYRAPDHNDAVGGKPTSYHLFTDGKSAADFDCPSTGFQAVFDWIRLESGLPFDKVIMESNAAGQPRCIHVQVDKDNPPRREAYVGGTGNSETYTQVAVV